MSVIVYEGVFDPPHIGHMWAALDAAESELAPEKVIVVPTSDAAAQQCSHKSGVTHELLRLQMCRECFPGLSPNIIVSDIAIKLKLIYSVDIVETLYSLWGKTDTWYWLCGADWAGNLNGFYNLKRFKELARFLVVGRSGYDIGSGPFTTLKTRLTSNLSSSFIRQRAKSGQSIAPFVSAEVEESIRAFLLYKKMTKEEFENNYAARSGITVESLHKEGQTAVPCNCGEPNCLGWQMTSMIRK